MAAVLTSDQVNYMIWRYLQESGFRESARAFQCDSKADRLDPVFCTTIKPGALVCLIQRGLQWEEAAALVDRDGTLRKTQRPFHFFPTAPPIDEDEGVGSDNNPVEDDDDDDEEDSMTVQSTKSPPATTSATSANAKKHGMDEGVNGVTKKRRKNASNGKIDADVLMADAVPSPPLTEELITTNGRSVGTQIEDVVEITEADTLIVEEDDKGIVSCAWNPVLPTLLATASAKSIARIWNVPEDAVTSGDLEQFDLPHEPSRMSTEKAHVTAIRWSPDGIRLASGSYDGQTRIWTAEGKLEHNMWLHDGPVSSLKWNKSTSILLALSCDGKMVAWDVATGDTHRVFDLGKDTVIGEVEWISNSQFMACGENGSIYQFDIGVEEPLHSRTMHSGEVSCIAWDDLSSTIATGGQDAVIRVWHQPHKETTPTGELCGHTAPVVAIAWQPGPAGFGLCRILASASNDTTVRLWDTVTGTCLRVLKRHMDPIERICFSPDGSRLASGANGAVLVWRTETGALTHVYDRAKSRRKNESVISDDFSEITEISWDLAGLRMAIGEGSHKCAIVCINTKTPVAAAAVVAVEAEPTEPAADLMET